MAAWSRGGGRVSWKRLNNNIAMTMQGEMDLEEPMMYGWSEDPEDNWMRPALRYAIISQRKQDRCLAIMTLVSFLLILTFTVCILLLLSRDYAKACAICNSVQSAMDQSTDPCQDFYQYSCGNWEANVVIPEGHSKWGSFTRLYAQNQQLLKRLLEEDGSAYNGRHSEALRKAKDYYRACMNETLIEQAGSWPLKKLINQLGGWSIVPPDTPGLVNWDENLFQLTQAIVATHKLDTAPLFGMFFSPDERNSSINMINFIQSGLGFAAREFYSDNDTSQENAYASLVAKIVVLLSLEDYEVVDLHNVTKHSNYATAFQRMMDIVEFEANMSKIFMPKTEFDDPTNTYNKMTLENFAQLIPQVNISLYINEMFADDVPLDQMVLVPTVSYFGQLNELLEHTPARLLADYLTLNAVIPMMKYLSKIYQDIFLEYSAIFSGSNSSLPLWEKCLKRTDNDFGFVTGALFVKEMVTPQLKNETEDLIQYIRQAFLDNLPTVTWMDNATKEAAEEKARAIEPKIGFPSWIEDPVELDEYYATANITARSCFENAMNLKDYSLQWMRSHLGKPVDRTEWHMTPAVVNAYYSSSFNEIVFPSGILQPPFYDVTYPMSMNFGAIGMVMGHELTHGFDNHGRKFNKEGNLKDWWGNASAQAYENNTECMINQYSGYRVGSTHLDGTFTLSENIADNGGLKVAYHAYHSWREEHPSSRERRILGMTEDQLFFLGFSQVWCTYVTPKYAELATFTDSHSAEKYRVNGAVSNMPEFASVYNCPSGSPMAPSQRCRVW